MSLLKICGNCIFFEGQECHRHAPVYPVHSDSSLNSGKFPKVALFNWCGDFIANQAENKKRDFSKNTIKSFLDQTAEKIQKEAIRNYKKNIMGINKKEGK
jgi:hypothetical protein